MGASTPVSGLYSSGPAGAASAGVNEADVVPWSYQVAGHCYCKGPFCYCGSPQVNAQSPVTTAKSSSGVVDPD